jgi:serine/threonine protein kinase
MELVTDGRLTDVIKERFKAKGRFSDNEASALMRGVLQAVCYVHDKNIVHRDLKPGKAKIDLQNFRQYSCLRQK